MWCIPWTLEHRNLLISKKMYDEISDENRPVLDPRVPILFYADGNRIPCFGNAVFSMMLGPLYLEKRLVVAEITDDILLGADVILGDPAGRADMLFSQNIILFRGIEIPIETAGYPNRVRKVQVDDDYKLAPLSEAVVDVFIERYGDTRVHFPSGAQ